MAATPPDLSGLFPGFDALQGLTRGAGSLPGLGAWVTPTIDPDELGKRIEELKTVQFWLDQNSRLITTTIQAMEVQRMTLTTLRTMNVQAQDLAEAFKIHLPEQKAASKDAVASSKAAPAFASAPAPASKAPRTDPPRKTAAARTGFSGEDPPPAGVADPMQWWNTLAQQFTQIASQALKNAPAGGVSVAARDAAIAGAPASGGVDTLKKAARAPGAAGAARGTRRARVAPTSAEASPSGPERARAGRGPSRR
jgi:hypothetical protein